MSYALLRRAPTFAMLFVVGLAGLGTSCKHGEKSESSMSAASAPAANGEVSPTAPQGARTTEAAAQATHKQAKAAGRLVIAVAPFGSADGKPGWLGLVVADHVARRLTMASGVDTDTQKRAYPVEVFSWRQTASAARSAGIALSEIETRAGPLLRELGADRIVSGRYTLDGSQAKIRWQTLDGTQSKTHEAQLSLTDLSKGAYDIGAAVLADINTRADPQQAPEPLPALAAENWGRALEILARQSRTARASVVLPATDLIKARVALKSVTTAAPMFAPAWGARAVVAVMEDDWEGAKAALQTAETVTDPADPSAALARSYVHERTAQQEQARKVLRSAVEQHPGSLEVLGYLGDAYYSLGEYELALPVFEQYLDRVPKSPYAARRRDAVLARLGRKDEALTNAEQLFAQHPKSVAILAALASRQIDAGQLDKARATLQGGLEATPDHPLLLTRLSYVELEGGDAKKALELAQKAVKVIGDGRGEPVAGYAHIDLARALAVVGRREEAKASLLKAVRLGVSPGDLDRLANDPRLNGFIKFPIVLPAQK